MINHISSQRVNHLLTQVSQFYFIFHPSIHCLYFYFIYFHKPQRTTGLNIDARRDHLEVAVATPAGFGFDTYILTANIWSQVWIRNKMVDSLAPSLYLLSHLHYGINRKKESHFLGLLALNRQRPSKTKSISGANSQKCNGWEGGLNSSFTTICMLLFAN